MEAQEEALAGSVDHALVIKGKRTKRQRPHSPFPPAGVSSSSSTAEGGGYDHGVASPASSADFNESTEEEEDMANCLILLAQGQTRKLPEPAAVHTAAANKVGFYLYQCRTCDRCFPSFQALGGHRASHKKPKAASEEKKTLAFMDELEDDRFNNNGTALSLQIGNRGLCGNNKSRMHECSVCGAQFTSGQALGGHMRRHRTFTSSNPDPLQETKKQSRNALSLDLNLPAPEDDHRESKFPFAGKQQTLVFSASSLVDCHY